MAKKKPRGWCGECGSYGPLRGDGARHPHRCRGVYRSGVRGVTAQDALACIDCGAFYAEFGLDMTLPDVQWQMIHDCEGGILCPSCMVRRAAKVRGAVAVRAVIELVEAEDTPEDRAMSREPKKFPLADVISAGWGVLVSERGIGAVYDVLNFMTGDSLYTHQLPRAGRQVQPFIVRQHPALTDLDTSPVSPETWRAWLTKQEKRFGKTLTLTPIAAGEYGPTDPLLELASMTNKPIITVSHAQKGKADV